VALHSEIVVFQGDIEIRQDQLVLDEAPHNAGHLVPSSSMTGLATLIFAIAVTLDYETCVRDLRRCRATASKPGPYRRRPAVATPVSGPGASGSGSITRSAAE
jgi:hypothetical protein